MLSYNPSVTALPCHFPLHKGGFWCGHAGDTVLCTGEALVWVRRASHLCTREALACVCRVASLYAREAFGWGYAMTPPFAQGRLLGVGAPCQPSLHKGGFSVCLPCCIPLRKGSIWLGLRYDTSLCTREAFGVGMPVPPLFAQGRLLVGAAPCRLPLHRVALHYQRGS